MVAYCYTRKNCIKLFTIAILFVFVSSVLCACNLNKSEDVKEFYDFLGTSVSLHLKGLDKSNNSNSQLNSLYQEIQQELNTENELYSIENPNSTVSKFNSLSSNSEMKIDGEFYKVFNLVKEAYTETNGNFDPTVMQLVDLWGFTKRHLKIDYSATYPYDRDRDSSGGFILPSEEYIAAFLSLCDFSKVTCYQKDGEYYLHKGDLSSTVDGVTYYIKLDLSGAIKGYTAQKIVEIVKKANYNNFWLSIGTSSIYLSEEPSYEAMKLEIANPQHRYGESLGYLQIKDKYVSTSGTYENNYKIGNQTFHHIIDSKTGKPADTDIVSATIIGSESLLSDALSTAVIVMGRANAITFLEEKYPNLSYVIVDNQNQVYSTSDFTITSSEYFQL